MRTTRAIGGLTRAALALTAAAWGTGCAIDDAGFVTRRYYESDTAWIVDLEAFGLHLVTNPLDRGFTLGHTKRTYFIPKRDAPRAAGDPIDVGALVAPHAAPEPRDAPPGGMRSLGPPIAVDRQATGVTFDANDHAVGVTFGVQSRSLLRIPVDFDGVVALRLDRSDPGGRSLILKETEP